jgi:probable rRNA maturation factor
MGVGSEMVVGLTVVGDRKMKELNKKYLHKNGTTDVLSFSQTEEVSDEKFVEPKVDGLYLGDVVVSWPQAVKQALEQQITVDEEIDFLMKHGLLHLMGVHHD